MPLNLERLEALMGRRKLEPKDIAEAIHISSHTVYRWTKGTVQPTAFNLSLLADVLKTSTDYLLGITNDPSPPMRSKADLTELEFLLIDAYRRGDLKEIMRLLGNVDD